MEISYKVKAIISAVFLISFIIGFAVYASKRSKMIDETKKNQDILDAKARGLKQLTADDEAQIKKNLSDIDADYAKTNAPFYIFLLLWIVSLGATIYFGAHHFADKSVITKASTQYYYF